MKKVALREYLKLKKNKSNFIKNNFFLLYGENLGLKKEIKTFIFYILLDLLH